MKNQITATIIAAGLVLGSTAFSQDNRKTETKTEIKESTAITESAGVPVNAKISKSRAKLAELPAAVQATIRSQGGSDRLEKVDRETKNGRNIYKVEIQREGKNSKLEIAEDGKILKDNGDKRKIDVKENGVVISESAGTEVIIKTHNRLKYAEVPAAVQKTIRTNGGSDSIDDIEKETKDGRVIYQVQIKRDGQNTKLQIAEDGTIVKDNANKP